MKAQKKAIDGDVKEAEGKIADDIALCTSSEEIAALAEPAHLKEHREAMIILSKQLHIAIRTIDAYGKHSGHSTALFTALDEGEMFASMAPVTEVGAFFHVGPTARD